MGYSGGDNSYCPSCGESLEPSDYFCPQCGRENEDAEGNPSEVSPNRRADEPRAENGGWNAEQGGDGWGNEPDQAAGWGDRRESRRDGQPRNQRQHGRRRRPRPARQSEAESWSPPGLPGSRRDREPGWRPVLAGIGLAITSLVLLVIVQGLVVSLSGQPVDEIGGEVLIASAAFGQYVGFFGLAVVYLRYARDFTWQTLREYLGVRVPSLKEVGIAVGSWFVILGLVMIVGLLISLLGLESADNEGANQLAEGAGADPLLIFGVFALMFLVVGPCEEILYRGVIQNRIRERFSTVLGIVAASVIFGSVHVIALAGSDPTAILTTISILTVTSLVLGGVYEYTGNLIVPWLLHSLHNSIAFSVLLFFSEEALLLPAVAGLVPA